MTTDDMNLPEDAGLPTPEEMVPADLDNWQRKRLDLSRIASGVQRIREELPRRIGQSHCGPIRRHRHDAGRNFFRRTHLGRRGARPALPKP